MALRYEPYFSRFNCVLVLKSPKAPSGIPHYQHITCAGLIPANRDVAPPRVCPICHADTVKEQRDVEIAEQYGAKLLKPAPEKVIQPALKTPPFPSDPA